MQDGASVSTAAAQDGVGSFVHVSLTLCLGRFIVPRLGILVVLLHDTTR